MKFKSKIKGCQLVVKVKLSYGNTVNIKELDRFSHIYLRSFLKPKLLNNNLIEYTGAVGISLYERLKKPVTIRDFLLIMEQIVVAIQKMQKNNMPINNLVMSTQYVYFNEATKALQFIYLPTISGQTNWNCIEFINSIIYYVTPANERDGRFMERFIQFFRSMRVFDINRIEDFIAGEDRSVVNTIQKQLTGKSGFMTNKSWHYSDNNYEEATGLLEDDSAEDVATRLLDDDSIEEEATGLLEDDSAEDAATSLLNDYSIDDEYTKLLDDEEKAGALFPDTDADEGTVLLTENNRRSRFPVLLRTLNNERIIVNKPVFRLGKEKSYVDYFVSNNVTVSRSHADIITRGTRYFVRDLNSKNGTYINGKETPIYCEIEIHDGDTLVLSNEEFIFNV